MKRLLSLALPLAMALAANAQSQTDPVVMEIGGKEIKRSEFEYIYNKNNSASTVEKKDLDEYVGMFINFKLKVLEAENAGIDTTQAFIKEFEGYRAQLAKGYLTDKEADEEYVRRVYERLKENVRASHILIDCPEGALPADTLRAYGRAMEVYELLKSGADFEETAKLMSDDPSVKYNGGDLGYFTALQMVPSFEAAVYELQPGEISLPVRSRFGYHVIKMTDRRPDRGKVHVAHIYKHISQDAAQSVVDEAMAQMDSLYAAIMAGADFAELAKTYSDDKASAQRGGELGWVGMRQTIPAFEDKIFAMADGEVSRPFVTPVGIHIVKRFEHKLIEPYEVKHDQIVMMLNRMGENDKGQKALIARLKKEYAMSATDQQAYEMLLGLAPDAQLGDSAYVAALAGRDDVLFTLDGRQYGVQGFIDFVNGNSRLNRGIRAVVLSRLMDLYRDRVVLDYEDSRLEDKYPEFALLVNEYRDGILLFDISNREVWNKASSDEEGLEAYFKKHCRDYRWDEPHFKGMVVHCVSDSLEKPVKQLLKGEDYADWVSDVRKAFMSDSVKLVKVERGLYVKGDNKYVDFFKFKGEAFEQPEGFPYTFIYGKLLKRKPEDFRDVRGQVSADYQNYLEKEWVESLRKKYADQIIIHQDVLKTVNNH